MQENEQTIMWTACPNGVAGGTLRLSVFVTHRLVSAAEQTLKGFPDVVRWPEHDIAFKVVFESTAGGDAPLTTAVVASARLIGPAKEPGMWAALFSETTTLVPYTFEDYKDHPVESFSVRSTYSYIRDQYARVAALSPRTSPTAIDALVTHEFNKIAFSPHEEEGLLGQVERRRSLGHAATLINDVAATIKPNVKLDFVEATLFHQPLALRTPRTKQAPPTPPVKVPRLDFHQIASSLGDYPEVMRRVGLVVDLEVDVPREVPAEGTVRVVPLWEPESSFSRDVTPRTAYYLDTTGGSFGARSRTPESDITRGWLAVGNGNYDLTEVDVDGAVIKVVDWVVAVQRISQYNRIEDVGGLLRIPSVNTTTAAELGAASQINASLLPAKVTYDTISAQAHRPRRGKRSKPAIAAGDRAREEATAEETALPSLRSAGLSVSRRDRSVGLQEHFTRAQGDNDLLERHSELLQRAAREQGMAVTRFNQAALHASIGTPASAVGTDQPYDITGGVTLYAEQLARGYRPDIYQESRGEWLSLCAREGRYTFDKAGVGEKRYSDEGWISLGATRTATEPHTLRVHESLFAGLDGASRPPAPAKPWTGQGTRRSTRMERERRAMWD